MSASFRKHLTCPTYDAVRRLKDLRRRRHSGDAVLKIVPEHKALDYFKQASDPHLGELAELLDWFIHAHAGLYRNPAIRTKIDEILASRSV